MTYESEVLADNPVIYWRLGESSGSIAVDDSGNGNDGTYANSPTLGQPSLLVSDPANTAVGFTGSAIADCPDSTDLTEFTVECWHQTSVVGAGVRHLAERYLDAAGSGGQIFALLNENGAPLGVVSTTSGVGFVDSPTAVNDGEAHHLVITFVAGGGANNFKLYIDGVLDTQASHLGTLATSDVPFRAGNDWQEAFPATGVLDEVAYYATALSPARILAHYNAGVEPPTPPHIITSILPNGTEGESYFQELNVTGDPGTWSITDGTLPDGIDLDPVLGTLSGTPTEVGEFCFDLTYTQTDNGLSDTVPLCLTIEPPVPLAGGWLGILNGSTICGSECEGLQVDACLKVPPVGLGVPALRIEDQTYPQRDGVEHFADWYEPRIITMEATIGGSSAGCGCESDAHAAARRVASAWARQCDDVELVIRPDICTDPEDREITGPFGIIGRPRVAEITWRRGKFDAADALLRFDAVDHRIYILDADGTPGSGAECASVDAPGNIVYWSAVGSTLAYHHWPLDFPNIGSQESSGVVIGAANDVIGSFDSAPVYSVQGPGILGYPVQVAPISYGLSMSAVQGPAAFQGRPWSVGYSSGMVGWWQETPVGAAVSGAGVLLDGSNNYRVGLDSLSRPAPVVKFGGSEVALNADAQAALGFTDDYHGQPVLVMFTWISGTLCIFAAHDGTSSPFLVQTVAGSGKPADGGAFQVLVFSAKVSNMMETMDLFADPEADGEDVMEQLAPYGFDTPLSELVLSDVGQLCVPIQVTFEQGPTYSDVYIFKSDGSYVGLAADPSVYQPTTLNTETGSATRYYGTMDATNDILGNPFLTVMPGETLNVFGGGDITICYRPAVIST